VKPVLVISSWLPNGSRELAKAARAAGWEIVCLKGKPAPVRLREREPVYYGSIDVAAKVARQLKLALLEPPLDWLARLPWEYRSRAVRFATVAEARRLTAPAFVKPADAANKCFDAGVYPGGWAIPERRGFDDTTPVLIAEVVAWEVEYRCFVLEGEVVTCSPYVRWGRWVRARDGKWPAPQPEVEQLVAFCRGLLTDREVRVPPAFTLDMGRLEAGGWAVVEANPAWSSGIYGCDPARILPVLQRASVPRGQLTDADQEWVISR
jgi:hypothetical protein